MCTSELNVSIELVIICPFLLYLKLHQEKKMVIFFVRAHGDLNANNQLKSAQPSEGSSGSSWRSFPPEQDSPVQVQVGTLLGALCFLFTSTACHETAETDQGYQTSKQRHVPLQCNENQVSNIRKECVFRNIKDLYMEKASFELSPFRKHIPPWVLCNVSTVQA